MRYHSKFSEITTLVKEGFAVLLYGERGTGKTTLIKHVAEELELSFYVVSCTRQTTLSYLLGFMNVSGVYVPSLLRKAVEGGGVYLLDELDAADPNVVLALNTLENGFLAFPDEVVECHKDFRLVATANPFNNMYAGRAVLDAATLDRFEKIEIPHDNALESSLVSPRTSKRIAEVRKAVIATNVDLHVSMRDAMRLDKREQLGMDNGYIENVLLKEYVEVVNFLPENRTGARKPQTQAKTVKELWEIMSEDV